MTDPRIEASKSLYKLKGMDQSLYVLTESLWGDRPPVIEVMNRAIALETIRKYEDTLEIIGPYLKAEAGKQWSSATILAMAGYNVSYRDYYAESGWVLTDCEGTVKKFIPFLITKLKTKDPRWQEIANIEGIVKLSSLNPDAYKKGFSHRKDSGFDPIAPNHFERF